MDKSMLVTAQEDRIHDIKDFLGRPVPILRRNWLATDPVGDIILSATFPETIWAQTMWAEKLKGFRFMRADLNFQIQVNGAPFDVGRLWSFWSPFDSERDDRRPFKSRTNTTGYNGVESDIGNGMTAELTIGYVSFFSHIDQLAGSQPYGSFRVQVLSGFESVNNTYASITVYCWLTNIDLAIPTDTATLGGTVPLPFRAQGKKQACSRMVTEAEVRSQTGIVTDGARMVGDVARAFANIPVVGEVAKPISWVADAVGGVASLLGFSKPYSLENVSRLQQVPAAGLTWTDGLDNSIVLGSKPNVEIETTHSVFGSEVDEMNISYIVSRPNWIHQFTWASTTVPLGPPLYTIPVHAGICGDDIAGLTATQWSTTHMSYVASMFEFWRGSISFRFSCVKNQFYSGRLVFVFYPGIQQGQVLDYTSLDVAKNYQWIWDIRRDADIQITIPFQSNLQYLKCRMKSNANPTPDFTADTMTGTLAVFIDNQLRAPASVPSGIQVHVWVHGGADMTFAIPDMVNYIPTDTPAGQLLPVVPPPSVLVEIPEREFRAQMLKVEQTFDVNNTMTGMANPEGSSLLVAKPKISMKPETSCIGEIHNNLRPLTRRFGYDFNSVNNLVQAPYLDPAYFFSNPNLPMNYISRLYVFYRGGVRYKVQVNETPAGLFFSTYSLSVDLASPKPYTPGPGFANLALGRFLHIQPIDLNPLLEMECPYYSNVPMQLISKVYSTLHYRMLYGYRTSADATPTFAYSILKASADDFSFGYLVGAPIVTRAS